MKALLLALLLTVPLSAVASTAQIDGNQLMAKCKFFFADVTGGAPDTLTNMERIDMGYCAGYVSGVTDLEAMWKGAEGKTTKATHYCMPTDATNGQMLLILKKWMENHPEKLHERADLIIHWALLEAFPCKQ